MLKCIFFNSHIHSYLCLLVFVLAPPPLLHLHLIQVTLQSFGLFAVRGLMTALQGYIWESTMGRNAFCLYVCFFIHIHRHNALWPIALSQIYLYKVGVEPVFVVIHCCCISWSVVIRWLYGCRCYSANQMPVSPVVWKK